VRGVKSGPLLYGMGELWQPGTTERLQVSLTVLRWVVNSQMVIVSERLTPKLTSFLGRHEQVQNFLDSRFIRLLNHVSLVPDSWSTLGFARLSTETITKVRDRNSPMA